LQNVKGGMLGYLVENEKSSIFTMLSSAPIGTKVDVQLLLKNDTRLSVTLIGIDKYKAILLKITSLPMNVDFCDFKVGSLCVVRILLEGTNGVCAAFRTEVISSLTFPSRILFISYPKELQYRRLRFSRRIDIHLPANLVTKDKKTNEEIVNIKGFINNISANGCRFEFQSKSETSVIGNITMKIQSNTGKWIYVKGEIKNHRISGDKCFLGIAFVDTNAGQSFLIDGYEL